MWFWGEIFSVSYQRQAHWKELTQDFTQTRQRQFLICILVNEFSYNFIKRRTSFGYFPVNFKNEDIL